MSRILCFCGAVIECDEEPQLACLIPDDARFRAVQDLSERFYELLQPDCDRSSWVKEHLVAQYPGPRPVPVPMDAMIRDLIMNTLMRASVGILECRMCGRLHVDSGGELASVYKGEKTPGEVGALVRAVMKERELTNREEAGRRELARWLGEKLGPITEEEKDAIRAEWRGDKRTKAK